MRRERDRPKRWVVVASLVLLYAFLEALSFLALQVVGKTLNLRYDPNPSHLSPQQRTAIAEFTRSGRRRSIALDGVVGWVPIAEANTAGMRDDREYDTRPAPNTLRIAAFGDSFTYGSDVALHQSWAKQITAHAGTVEVMNYGIPAGALDQAYLRYALVGTAYHPHVVFIGYMTENIARHVNVFRPFYTDMYRDWFMTKPRFDVRDGALALLRNPLSTVADYEALLRDDTRMLAELGRHDYHYQNNYNRGPLDVLPSVRFAKLVWAQVNQRLLHPIVKLDGTYDVKSEAFDVTVRLFDAFYQNVLENGALPIIVVFAEPGDQQRNRRGKSRRYGPLLDHFSAKGYRFIDTLNAFEPYESRYRVDELGVKWGHYSPLASAIVARYILDRLKGWDLLDPSRVDQAVQTERRRRG